VNGNSKILPEIHAYYNNAIFMYGVSASPYALEPNIGLSLFNAIWLTGGYAIPLNNEKYFRGATVGIQFNIAPVKQVLSMINSGLFDSHLLILIFLTKIYENYYYFCLYKNLNLRIIK
jgi:hypothetical protein